MTPGAVEHSAERVPAAGDWEKTRRVPGRPPTLPRWRLGQCRPDGARWGPYLRPDGLTGSSRPIVGPRVDCCGEAGDAANAARARERRGDGGPAPVIGPPGAPGAVPGDCVCAAAGSAAGGRPFSRDAGEEMREGGEKAQA